MIMLILAPLVGVLGALLLAYGAWLIYPPAGFVVAGGAVPVLVVAGGADISDRTPVVCRRR
ncbi:prophage protein [Escherichia coli]|nr:prophage protein [Escherichia coli]